MARDLEFDSGIDVINAPPERLKDLYHQLLRGPWWSTILTIAGLAMATNFIFGIVFLCTGGVSGARPGSFADAFFFSVQTFATIGYGAMFPQSKAAHFGVMIESIVSLLVAAISTGLVFSKFSVPTARLAFSRAACVSPFNGQQALTFRVGNLRGNYVIEAQIRVTLTRAERTSEGHSLYRMLDLKLLRERSPGLGRSWTVVHVIDPESPLYGATPDSMQADESEVLAALTGIDQTSSQIVHGRHLYDAKEIRFGERLADMLRAKPGGRVELDFGKFHLTEKISSR